MRSIGINGLLLVSSLLASIGVQVRPPAALNPPDELRATAISSSSLHLEWQDNSLNETAFEIGRCLGVTCRDFVAVAKVPANSYTFTDTNLKAHTTFRYRVRALGNDKIFSAYSKIAGATTLTQRPKSDPTTAFRQSFTRGAPAGPSNLSASALSTSQINLTWTNNTNNATGLYIERALSATGPWKRITSLPANATSSGNAGLKASTTYYYRVMAYNSAGNFTYSNVASATTHSMLPKGPPGNLTASAAGSKQINLSWTNNASDATGFKIERCQGNACSNFTEIATTPANATSYQNTDLSISTSYSYRVQAFNSTKHSEYSNTATATTARDTTPPAIPTGLTATVVSSSRINLRWSASIDGGGSSVVGYSVFQEGARIGTTVATTYPMRSLAANTQYCFTVSAYDKGGNVSAESAPVCAKTKPNPEGDTEAKPEDKPKPEDKRKPEVKPTPPR